jgi:hypothetical protein
VSRAARRGDTVSRWTYAAVMAALLLTTAGIAEPGTHTVAAVGEQPAPVAATSGTVASAVATPARSVPVRLRIPAIGLSVALSSVGLNSDGTVHVPTDFARPGWFRLGAAPGQLGSAVIVGHVDSYRGPAVFFRLRSLRAGDAVQVDLANGGVARFVVSRVTSYPKDRFPARLVYGSHGYSALQLVTCGGTFDARARSYRSNIVVYSVLAGTTPAAAG